MSERAPGGLDLVRRFLNTVSFSRGQDALHGPDQLPQWCAEEGFDCGAQGEPGLDRLRAFREGLRQAALANAGHADVRASWRALEPYAQASSYTLRVGEDGLPALAPGGAREDRAIASLLAAIYDAVRSGEWYRFKACKAGDCLWAFYDESKNGSGTWCSMAACGNRLKARRRRQRTSKILSNRA